jgi:hypothetical protein
MRACSFLPVIVWQRYTCRTNPQAIESAGSAGWVHRHIVPRSWSRGWLLVLAGYIDGSNLHEGSDIVAVGGVVAVSDAWPAWEGKWDEVLAVKSQ